MTPDKLRLIRNLDKDTYASFGSSEIHGIGVIAIRGIPEGVDPLPIISKAGHSEKIVNLIEEELLDMPPEVSAKIRSLFVKTEGSYPVHYLGLNGTDVRFYVNHSDDPNMVLDYNFGVIGAGRIRMGMLYCPFKAARKIEKGEELTYDYRTVRDADDICKQYPFLKEDGVLKKAWKKFVK
jgi:SET domain-containing protein